MKTLEYRDFNKVYAKYSRKDYFGNKHFIRQRIDQLKIVAPGYVIAPGEIKEYLKSQKAKSWKFAVERFKIMQEGKKVVKSERFSWELFKKYAK
jgi:hypothetical protein